jgi:hypothetical protein
MLSLMKEDFLKKTMWFHRDHSRFWLCASEGAEAERISLPLQKKKSIKRRIQHTNSRTVPMQKHTPID